MSLWEGGSQISNISPAIDTQHLNLQNSLPCCLELDKDDLERPSFLTLLTVHSPLPYNFFMDQVFPDINESV